MSDHADPLRIAMWSAPRNISTAMMRAFENRDDCVVRDEPYYACYLAATGIEHPMRNEVMMSQPTEWRVVIDALTAPLPPGVTIEYQKHMTHHMVVDLDESWLRGLTHAFLVRDPVDMVASYVQKRGEVTVADLGLPRQVEVYESVCRATGQTPPVVDARDVLQAPETVLRGLCKQLGIEFSNKMLAWPPGLRKSDGVWASHWYNAVARSTGFGSYPSHSGDLPPPYQTVVDSCREYYEYFLERKSVYPD
ncbi:MAG: HAD family hydrolase [Gammaproteobacteria bacterium]|nr:HAD family hydrolase [Gammaproteobacteria bacterium]